MSRRVTSGFLFPLGLTCATLGALEALNEAGQQAAEFLHLHQSGDGSEMKEERKWKSSFR